MTQPPLATFWRCLKCRMTGVGDSGANRHTTRPPYHPTETTTRRDVFARWQKEAETR